MLENLPAKRAARQIFPNLTPKPVKSKKFVSTRGGKILVKQKGTGGNTRAFKILSSSTTLNSVGANLVLRKRRTVDQQLRLKRSAEAVGRVIRHTRAKAVQNMNSSTGNDMNAVVRTSPRRNGKGDLNHMLRRRSKAVVKTLAGTFRNRNNHIIRVAAVTTSNNLDHPDDNEPMTSRRALNQMNEQQKKNRKLLRTMAFRRSTRNIRKSDVTKACKLAVAQLAAEGNATLPENQAVQTNELETDDTNVQTPSENPVEEVAVADDAKTGETQTSQETVNEPAPEPPRLKRKRSIKTIINDIRAKCQSEANTKVIDNEPIAMASTSISRSPTPSIPTDQVSSDISPAEPKVIPSPPLPTPAPEVSITTPLSLTIELNDEPLDLCIATRERNTDHTIIKPPAPSQSIPATAPVSATHQSDSISPRRRIRKINDCIAMLTGKLQERLGVPFIDQTSSLLAVLGSEFTPKAEQPTACTNTEKLPVPQEKQTAESATVTAAERENVPKVENIVEISLPEPPSTKSDTAIAQEPTESAHSTSRSEQKDGIEAKEEEGTIDETKTLNADDSAPTKEDDDEKISTSDKIEIEISHNDKEPVSIDSSLDTLDVQSIVAPTTENQLNESISVQVEVTSIDETPIEKATVTKKTSSRKQKATDAEPKSTKPNEKKKKKVNKRAEAHVPLIAEPEVPIDNKHDKEATVSNEIDVPICVAETASETAKKSDKTECEPISECIGSTNGAISEVSDHTMPAASIDIEELISKKTIVNARPTVSKPEKSAAKAKPKSSTAASKVKNVVKLREEVVPEIVAAVSTARKGVKSTRHAAAKAATEAKKSPANKRKAAAAAAKAKAEKSRTAAAVSDRADKTPNGETPSKNRRTNPSRKSQASKGDSVFESSDEELLPWDPETGFVTNHQSTTKTCNSPPPPPPLLDDPTSAVTEKDATSDPKPKKKRKSELAQIIADQLLESFKEIDEARINELKKIHDMSFETTDELLTNSLKATPPPRRSTQKMFEKMDTKFRTNSPKVEAKKAAAESKAKEKRNARTTKACVSLAKSDACAVVAEATVDATVDELDTTVAPVDDPPKTEPHIDEPIKTDEHFEMPILSSPSTEGTASASFKSKSNSNKTRNKVTEARDETVSQSKISDSTTPIIPTDSVPINNEASEIVCAPVAVVEPPMEIVEPVTRKCSGNLFLDGFSESLFGDIDKNHLITTSSDNNNASTSKSMTSTGESTATVTNSPLKATAVFGESLFSQSNLKTTRLSDLIGSTSSTAEPSAIVAPAKNTIMDNLTSFEKLNEINAASRAPFMSPRWDGTTTTATLAVSTTTTTTTTTATSAVTETVTSTFTCSASATANNIGSGTTDEIPDKASFWTGRNIDDKSSNANKNARLMSTIKSKTEKILTKISRKKMKRSSKTTISPSTSTTTSSSSAATAPTNSVLRKPLLRPSILSSNSKPSADDDEEKADEVPGPSTSIVPLPTKNASEIFDLQIPDERIEAVPSTSRRNARSVETATQATDPQSPIENNTNIAKIVIALEKSNRQAAAVAAAAEDSTSIESFDDADQHTANATAEEQPTTSTSTKTQTEQEVDELSASSSMPASPSMPVPPAGVAPISADIHNDSSQDSMISEIVSKIREKVNRTSSDDELCIAEPAAKSAPKKQLPSLDFDLAPLHKLNEPDETDPPILRPPIVHAVRDNASTAMKLSDVNDGENSNAEALDAEMDDAASQYTALSHDTSASGNKKRKRKKRSILSRNTRRSRKRDDSFALPAATYFCDICRRAFKNQSGLTSHRSTITHIAKLSEQEFLEANKSVDVSPPITADDARAASATTGDAAVHGTIVEPPPQPESIAAVTHEFETDEQPKSTSNTEPLPLQEQQSELDGYSVDNFESTSPTERSTCFNSTPKHTSAALTLSTNAQMTLSQEQRLFYECCSMLKGSDASVVGAEKIPKSTQRQTQLPRSHSNPRPGASTHDVNTSAIACESSLAGPCRQPPNATKTTKSCVESSRNPVDKKSPTRTSSRLSRSPSRSGVKAKHDADHQNNNDNSSCLAPDDADSDMGDSIPLSQDGSDTLLEHSVQISDATADCTSQCSSHSSKMHDSGYNATAMSESLNLDSAEFQTCYQR